MGRVSYAMLLLAAASAVSVPAQAQQSKERPVSTGGKDTLEPEFVRQLGRHVEVVGTIDATPPRPRSERSRS
jgi:hypothetical protein